VINCDRFYLQYIGCWAWWLMYVKYNDEDCMMSMCYELASVDGGWNARRSTNDDGGVFQWGSHNVLARVVAGFIHFWIIIFLIFNAFYASVSIRTEVVMMRYASDKNRGRKVNLFLLAQASLKQRIYKAMCMNILSVWWRLMKILLKIKF